MNKDEDKTLVSSTAWHSDLVPIFKQHWRHGTTCINLYAERRKSPDPLPVKTKRARHSRPLPNNAVPQPQSPERSLVKEPSPHLTIHANSKYLVDRRVVMLA